jgi:hypothetical protein
MPCACVRAVGLWTPGPVFKKPDYVYHGTWAHLNGVLRKYLQSVCVDVSLIVPKQWLSKNGNKHKRNIRKLFDGEFSMRSVSYQIKAGEQFLI